MISRYLRRKYVLRLISCNTRCNGKSFYRVYLTYCIFYLSFPFGFLFYKRKAKEQLRMIYYEGRL